MFGRVSRCSSQDALGYSLIVLERLGVGLPGIDMSEVLLAATRDASFIRDLKKIVFKQTFFFLSLRKRVDVLRNLTLTKLRETLIARY